MGIFDNIESIFINNKEVQSIVLTDGGGVLYEKQASEPLVMSLTVTGSSFETSSTPFVYTGEVFVDWGDNTELTEYTGGKLTHNFTDGLTTHSVKIYGDITSLGSYCFRGCTGLTFIELSSSITSLGEGCFTGCTGLTSINLPSSIISLGSVCFGDCTSLTSIELPSSITSLREGCFTGCTGLTSIELPSSITSLGGACFGDCTGLTSIDLPSSITSLGEACFVNCANLTSINLSSGITSIGVSCFEDCTSLTSIDLPSSITTLGDYCFMDCTGLTSIDLEWVGTSILTYNSNWIRDANTNLKFEIPEGTTQLYIDKGYPEDKLVEKTSTTLWAPELNGETGANYTWSYSEANGEAIGKGFIFKNGFDNTGSWELSFDFKHNTKYTGICFLTDLANGYSGKGSAPTALTSWEGSWPEGTAYASYDSGTVGYFDVKVTKIDSTHIRLQSEALNKDTTVEVSWLASATKLSFGARHNEYTDFGGACIIKNILVTN